MNSVSISGNPNINNQYVKASCSMYNISTRRFLGATLSRDCKMPFILNFTTNHSVIIIELCTLDMCSNGFYVLNIQLNTFHYYPGTCRILLSEPLFELEFIPHELQFRFSATDVILPIPCILSKLPDMQNIRVKIIDLQYDSMAIIDLINKFHKNPRFIRNNYYVLVMFNDYLYEQHYLLSNTTSLLTIPENSHLFLVVESTYEHVSNLDVSEFRILLGWCALPAELKQNKLIQSKSPFPFEAHPLNDSFPIQVHYSLIVDEVQSHSPILRRRRTVKRKPSMEPLLEPGLVDDGIHHNAPMIDRGMSFADAMNNDPSIVPKSADSLGTPLMYDSPAHSSLESNISAAPNTLHNSGLPASLDISLPSSINAVAPDVSAPLIPSYNYDLNKQHVENNLPDESNSSIIDLNIKNYNCISIVNNNINRQVVSKELPNNNYITVSCAIFACITINNMVLINKNEYALKSPTLYNKLYITVAELNDDYNAISSSSWVLDLDIPCHISINDKINIQIGSECVIIDDLITTPIKHLNRLDSGTSNSDVSLIDIDLLLSIPKLTVNQILDAQRINNSFEITGYVCGDLHVPGDEATSSIKNILHNDKLENKGSSPVYCRPVFKVNCADESTEMLAIFTCKPFHMQVDGYKFHYDLVPLLGIKIKTIKMTETDELEISGIYDDAIFYKIDVLNRFKLQKHVFKHSLIITPIINESCTLMIIQLAKIKNVQVTPIELYMNESIKVEGHDVKIRGIKLISNSVNIPITIYPIEYINVAINMKTKKCKVFEIKRKIQHKAYYN
eukprot:NODE_232_length_13679_cov_0.197349.p1 type:complete len:790 gc:universal NODE_232_length_13679_cov_0.197349:7298-9667(+)